MTKIHADDYGRTLDAIGDELGVTRERVRQIQVQAVGKVLAAHVEVYGQPPRDLEELVRPFKFGPWDPDELDAVYRRHLRRQKIDRSARRKLKEYQSA